MKIKLIDFNGPAPVRAHDNDAGADVFSPQRPDHLSGAGLQAASASV